MEAWMLERGSRLALEAVTAGALFGASLLRPVGLFASGDTVQRAPKENIALLRASQ